jgi:hypothetical protein
VDGARIFHDIPGDGFSLDHVVISTHGLFVIETKTWSKRSPDDRVTFDGTRLLVGGRTPSRDPIRQVRAASDWLGRTTCADRGVTHLICRSSGRITPLPCEQLLDRLCTRG